jgi:hypothetical protein
MWQLINWGRYNTTADVFWKLINPFGLGVIHTALNELSYVDLSSLA